MYGRNDLRASLAPEQSEGAPSAFKDASYVRFYDGPPQESAATSRDWYARGQTMVVAYSEVEPGAVFERADQCDEYAVVLPDDGGEIEIEIDEGTESAVGRAVAFVPAGRSRIRVVKAGRLLRLFTTRSADLVAKCVNASHYAEPDPNVAPFEPWPEPVGGRRVRVYSGSVPRQEG
ncbi:MAG TPA: hypothetical protein VNQ31_05820, partial [Sphingomonadaceae bacterium]|nr:hypothetical protein [Sphingomonadaceae bacterium]